MNKRLAHLTPEQREAALAKAREYQAQRRARRTEEQRAIELLYFRERQALLTDAEREAQRQRGRNLSSERRAAKKKKQEECGGCNKGIGSLKDSPELLRAAALYIEHWRDKEKKAA